MYAKVLSRNNHLDNPQLVKVFEAMMCSPFHETRDDVIKFKQNVENIEHLDQLQYHTTHLEGLDGYIRLNIDRLSVMMQHAYW